MRLSKDTKNGLISAGITLVAVVVAFLLPYFCYFRPQIQLLKSQVDSQLQSLDRQQQSLDAQMRALETQKQSQEIDIVRAGFELLQQRVDAKYPYAPDDPAFKMIEYYSSEAWKAIAEGDTNKAKGFIKKAFETLETIGGPPTVGARKWDLIYWGTQVPKLEP